MVRLCQYRAGCTIAYVIDADRGDARGCFEKWFRYLF